eukprot:554951_1
MDDTNYIELTDKGHNTPTVTIIRASRDVVATKHDKIHFKANIFKYVVLLIVGVSYLVYGSIKYNNAKQHPLTKTYQDVTESYPLPTTLACVDYNKTVNFSTTYLTVDSISYLDIDGQYDGKNINMNCDMIYDASRITKLTDTDKCIVVQSIDYQISSSLKNCFLIIPPSNVDNATSYTVSYIYWAYGYMDLNPFLLKHSNYSTPSFMADSLKYSIRHYVFHMDDFLGQNKEFFTDGDYSYTVYAALNWAEELFASPFSYNKLTLTLQENIDVDGDVIHAFDVYEGSKIIFIDGYSQQSCSNDTYSICSKILIHYQFKRKGITSDGEYLYLVEYAEKYLDYQLPDLLSGIGGIISVAQGIIVTFLSIVLMGFAFLCINWNGLAPYPNFDDNFTERMQRTFDYER